MKRRILALLMAGALFASVVSGASADRPIDNITENNCHGVVISYYASTAGITPAEAVEILGLKNAGEWNKLVKELCADAF
jgi:hypothetical protein